MDTKLSTGQCLMMKFEPWNCNDRYKIITTDETWFTICSYVMGGQGVLATWYKSFEIVDLPHIRANRKTIEQTELQYGAF